MVAGWVGSSVVPFPVVEFVGVGVTPRWSPVQVGGVSVRPLLDHPSTATSSRRPSTFQWYLSPSVFLLSRDQRVRRTPSSVRPQVRQRQLFRRSSAVTAQQEAEPVLARLLVVRTHWYSTVSLLVPSPMFPIAALTLSYGTLVGFSSRAFFRVSSRRSGLQRVREGLPHDSRVFRENLERPWTPCLTAFRPYTEKSLGVRRPDSQNFLASPAHGLGWPS